MSNSDNSASSNKAHIYLATQNGRTILAAGEKGTTKEDIYFAPAQQPNPGYAVPTAYDFSTTAGQKAWAKMNYADTSATSGAQLTVTHGQSRGAGTVGDQVLKLQRADNSFSLSGQTIQADNSPNNVFGPGVFGQSFDCIGSLTLSGNYVNGTAAVLSGFNVAPYAALNGTTKFLKFLGAIGALQIFELYNDASLSSGFTSGASGAVNLGPGVFTYSATQASGVTAKAYSLVLEEQNNILKIKEDTNSRVEIQTANTTFNHNVVSTGTISGATVSATTLTGTLSTAAQTNITSVGALNGGSITSGFGDIDNGSSAITTTGTVSGGTVAGDNTTLKKFNETKVDLGSVSGDQSSALNATNGSIYTLVATGGITINTIANAVAGTSMTIVVRQDGTGSRTLASTMLFSGGSKTLSTAPNSIDIISVFFDGTTYYASLTKSYA